MKGAMAIIDTAGLKVDNVIPALLESDVTPAHGETDTVTTELKPNYQQAGFVIIFLIPYVALNDLTRFQRDTIWLSMVYQKDSLLPVSLWALWSCREGDEVLLLHITRYCISRNNGVAR